MPTTRNPAILHVGIQGVQLAAPTGAWNMKKVCLLAVLLYLSAGFATGSPFPLQLEARVPFAPTAFPSAGRTYVVYELYVTNFSASPVTLRRIDVLDAQETSSKPVATFEGEQLDALLQPVG